MSGSAKAADDIEEVKWFPIDEVMNHEEYSKIIVPEHVEFFGNLMNYFSKELQIEKI